MGWRTVALETGSGEPDEDRRVYSAGFGGGPASPRSDATNQAGTPHGSADQSVAQAQDGPECVHPTGQKSSVSSEGGADQLNFTARQDGPEVTVTLAGSGVTDTEQTGAICFVRGTMIETDRSPVVIEELMRADRVETLDDGYQTIRWIGSRRILSEELAENPGLRPIRIRTGALGRGVPEADLRVSPQHRILVSSRIAERMFKCREILAPARQLLQINGIEVDEAADFVEYFHFLFDRHQIVFAEGKPMESLFTGIEALNAVSPRPGVRSSRSCRTCCRLIPVQSSDRCVPSPWMRKPENWPSGMSAMAIPF
nr:Hint domain-containing protein [Szabonella alba]